MSNGKIGLEKRAAVAEADGVPALFLLSGKKESPITGVRWALFRLVERIGSADAR